MNKVEERDIFLVGKLFENWDTNLDGIKSCPLFCILYIHTYIHDMI